MTSAATGEIDFKGVAFRSLLEVVRQQHGDQAVRGVRYELTDETKAVLPDPVLAASWYPASAYRDLHAAIQTVLKGGPETSRRLAYDAVMMDIQGIYRFAIRAFSPAWLMGFMPRIYQRYARGGQAELLEARSGFVHARWSGCRGVDHNIWMDFIGSCEAFLAVTGAEHIRYRIVTGGQDGDELTEAEFRWA